MAGYSDGDKMAQKRAEVMGGSKKTKNFAVMFLALLLTLVGAYLFLGKEPVQSATTGAATTASSAGVLTHDLAEFQDGMAHHYDFTASGGLKMKYFIIQARDGSLHAALDACESCWPAGKGYRQDGDEMVCQNCRMRFAIPKVGVAKGGCNPVPLPFTVTGSKVTVKTEDLESGRHFFDLKK